MLEPATQSECALDTLREVTEQLTCAICLRCYADPRVLPCLHVFCFHCLEEAVRRKNDVYYIRCPSCPRVTYLTDDGVGGLVAAFHLHHLFDIQDILQKTVSNGGELVQQCEKCGDTQATSFCRDCGQCVCDQCVNTHRKWSELAGHEIVGIRDVQKEAAGMLLFKKKTLLCSKHTNRELDMYCETCEELVCRCCQAQLHSDHHCDLVASSFARNRQVIEAKVNPLKAHLEAVNQALINVDANANAIVSQRETIEEDIVSTIKGLQTQLEQMKGQFLTTLQKITERKLERLALQKEAAEVVQAQLTGTLHFAEERLLAGTDGEVLAMKKYVTAQTEAIMRDLDHDLLVPCDRANVVFDYRFLRDRIIPHEAVYTTRVCPMKCVATGENLHLTSVMETTKVNVQIKDEFGENIFEPVDSITAELVLNDSALYCNVSKTSLARYTVSYVTTIPGIQRLHIRVNGQHIKGSPFPVRVKDIEATHKVAYVADSMDLNLVLYHNGDANEERAEIF